MSLYYLPIHGYPKKTMTNIATITLNPSIDKSTRVQELVPDQKLKCEDNSCEPGGGGINISRAIHNLGGNAKAWFLSGGHFGNFLTELIHNKGLEYEAFPIKNETRENLILFDQAKNNQYLLNSPGPEVSESEWQGFLDVLEKKITAGYLVASGSLPIGIPADFFGRLAAIARKKGIKFILDTAGEPLEIALKEGVYLVKPNLRELRLLSGLAEMDKSLARQKATELLEKYDVHAIVVSLGAEGALLVSKEVTEYVPSPEVEKKSTVGAGDSMVAGMVLSLSQNKTLSQAVRYGVACGSAATLNPGSALCTKKDADALFIEIEKKIKTMNDK